MNTPKNNMAGPFQGADRANFMEHRNQNIICFTRNEIETITKNYRTLIGRGGFGEVYEGILEDRSMVAVKRFIQNVKEDFSKEFIVHREINHKNVVRLIGYCIEENALTMVTEYIPNGNLNNVLHHDNRHIPLDVRLRIATECAEALAYMHTYMYTQVIHGDIKPGNILLDGRFNAKITDSGISRLVNTDKTLYTENIKGSIGYMDPLFVRDGHFTVKSDVYSFGVVLLELITRKKATTEVGKTSIIHLSRGVKGMREMFDAEIASQKNMKILEGVAKLAGECLRMERHTRPEMIDVAERLRMLRKASDQGRRQRIGLFSWIRKNKPSDVCCHFSFADMKDATNNFEASLVVGEGAFGRVYQGTIRGRETKVVIKRRQSWDPYSELEFHRVIEMMSKLQHHHIVPLIGYCYEEDEMILVYDYMACGSLRDRLYNTQSPPLTWIQRLKICIGAARALQYLHESHIIHGNLKTADILLDEEWTAKITDIGLSKIGSSSTDEATKSGFLDPEYVHTGQLTGKSDVYSFGAVLFEVICAPPVLDRVLQFEDILADWAARWKEEGNLRTIAGTYLKGKNNLRYLNKFTETAEKCLAYRGTDRPTMEDVVSDLEEALRLQHLFDLEFGDEEFRDDD